MNSSRRQLLLGVSSLAVCVSSPSVALPRKLFVGGSSLPLVGPGASWNGIALSGGTPPPEPPRITAKPAIHWLFPSELRVASNITIGVDADASGGVQRVDFWVEGRVQSVFAPSLYIDTAANGTTRTRYGYWITLNAAAFRVISESGAARIFATAYPNDPTMQTRTIGITSGVVATDQLRGDYAMTIYPRAAANDGTYNIGPSQTYTTILAAITQARTDAKKAPLFVFKETGNYELTNAADNYTNGEGFATFTADAGVTATLRRASAFAPSTPASWPWLPGWDGIEFRGSGIVFDRRNWSSITTSAKPTWFNGCKWTNSIGTLYSYYWNGGFPPSFGASNSAGVTNYWDDVTFEYVSGEGLKNQKYIRGCTINQWSEDLFSATPYVANNYVRFYEIQPWIGSAGGVTNYTGINITYAGSGGGVASVGVKASAIGAAGNRIVFEETGTNSSIQGGSTVNGGFTASSSSVAGSVLTVGGTVLGIVEVGQTISWSGVGNGGVIASFGTGSGGAGTYNLTSPTTTGSIAITGVRSRNSLANGAVNYKAGAVYVLAGLPTAGDTITTATVTNDATTNTRTYTWVSGAPGALEIQIGASVAASITNIVTAMAADPNLTATAGSSAITKTAGDVQGGNLQLKVDGAVVSTIALGFYGNDTNPTINDVVTAINAYGNGWSATVGVGRGTMRPSQLGSPVGNSSSLTDFAITMTAPLNAGADFHADWWQGYTGGSTRQNVIIRNNTSRDCGMDASLNATLFLDATLQQDTIVKGNVWAGNFGGTTVGGTTLSHLVYENNSNEALIYRVQTVAGDQTYSSYKNNASALLGYNGVGTWVADAPWINNSYIIANGNGPISGGSNSGNFTITKDGNETTYWKLLFVDYAGGDYRPVAAGLLLSNQKTRVNLYDGRGLPFADPDVVGAWSKNDPAPVYPF